MFHPGATVFEVGHTGFVIGSRDRAGDEGETEATAAAAAAAAGEASVDTGASRPSGTASQDVDPYVPAAAALGADPRASGLASSIPVASPTPREDLGNGLLTGTPAPGKPAQWLPWQSQSLEECAGQGVQWMVLEDSW